MLEIVEKSKHKNYKFIFIGIRDKSIMLPDNCINVGIVENQNDLARYYSMADVTVLTSKKETFSMIVAESLSCGTPVVGFKAGGPESITIAEFSDFVNFGDVETLISMINKWVDIDNLDRKAISKQAHEKYSLENMASNYINVYKKAIKLKK